ncbi:MAG: 1-acyl-sn-glycerol-3-phosphate acyltransferase [Caldiserica bacterium]|nr:1-acyl-sn-glycerol-3-phosphate acyltransferase [Caldisericota bacterium]
MGKLADKLRDAIYAFLVVLVSPVIYGLFRMRVRGRANLRGGGILVARHRSYWDIPVVCVACGPYPRVHFIARRGLARNPVFAPFVLGFATVIDRDRFGPDDFKKMLRAARRYKLLGIFPEGTTRPGAEPKTGAVRLAEMFKKPLIPVNIVPAGPYPPRKFPPRFPRITVHIGEPFPVDDLAEGLPPGLSRPERYRLMAERLMELIDRVGARAPRDGVAPDG